MVAVVDIWNRALALARARARVLATTENTESAYQCGLFYDEVRRSVLRAHHWNFARSQVALTIDKQRGGGDFNADFSNDFGGGTPPIPWIYSFKLPANVVTVLGVVTPSRSFDQTFFEVFPAWGDARVPNFDYFPFQRVWDPDGYEIVCANINAPTMVYTLDQQDPNQWDQLFESAVVSALSGRLAQTMSGDLNLAKLRLQDANNVITEARLIDSNEGDLAMVDNVPDWMAARGIYAFIPPRMFPPYGPLFVIP